MRKSTWFLKHICSQGSSFYFYFIVLSFFLMSESNYSAFFVLLFIFTILFVIIVAFLLLGVLNGAFATYAHHPLSSSLLSHLDFALYLFAFAILAVLFLLIAFAIQRKGG